MRVLFRPEARVEVLEAQNWYESRATGLGLEFARAVEAAIASASSNPEAFTQVAGTCRRTLLRKFPFSLVFQAHADELLVIAVFHQSRNPARLAHRTGR